MLQLPELVLQTIYKYLIKNNDKIKFKRKFPNCNFKVILAYVYNINDALKALSLGCYINKLLADIDYFDARLDKYREHQIYGCYINTLDELVALFTTQNSIKNIEFGEEFNSPVNKTNLPVGIERIEFGVCFNQPVNNLPDTVTHLTFWFDYNQPITNLPYGLKYLHVGYYYNQPLSNLPDTITHLIVGPGFNQCLTHVPASLKYLRIHENYTHELPQIPNLKIDFY
jgi:hypothetical protein